METMLANYLKSWKQKQDRAIELIEVFTSVNIFLLLYNHSHGCSSNKKDLIIHYSSW